MLNISMEKQEKPLNQELFEAEQNVAEAQERLSLAHDELVAARRGFEVASHRLSQLSEEAVSQNTPELQEQAREEHRRILLKELNESLAGRDFETVAALAQKLQKLDVWETKPQREDKEEESEENELQRAVAEFIIANEIRSEGDQQHYRERARIFLEKNPDVEPEDIVDALQREFDKGKPPKADLNWADRRAA